MKDYLVGAAIWLIAIATISIGIECCGDEVKPISTLPDILLPMTPVLVEPVDDPVIIPKPTPRPQAEVITNLHLDTWFVFESKEQLLVTSSPLGLVQVKQYDVSKISRSFIGKFVDGNGTSDEERTYPTSEEYKWIYSIKAKKSGTVELILYKQGITTEEELIRQTLTVMGHSPNPPPIPDPDPIVPDPVPVVTTFRVIFVKESGATLNLQQSSIPSAKAIRDYLNVKTTKENGQVGWREYDPQQLVTNEQPIMMALWRTVKPQLLPTPCLVIEVNGHATVKPFPSNVDEALSVLKKAGGE
jgi:hypothetical protein